MSTLAATSPIAARSSHPTASRGADAEDREAHLVAGGRRRCGSPRTLSSPLLSPGRPNASRTSCTTHLKQDIQMARTTPRIRDPRVAAPGKPPSATGPRSPDDRCRSVRAWAAAHRDHRAADRRGGIRVASGRIARKARPRVPAQTAQRPIGNRPPPRGRVARPRSAKPLTREVRFPPGRFINAHPTSDNQNPKRTTRCPRSSSKPTNPTATPTA
jgi:hypothetical protein